MDPFSYFQKLFLILLGSLTFDKWILAGMQLINKAEYVVK